MTIGFEIHLHTCQVDQKLKFKLIDILKAKISCVLGNEIYYPAKLLVHYKLHLQFIGNSTS